MERLLKKVRAAPFIAFYRLIGRSTTDYRGQWQSYWASVSSTGAAGQVLWDSDVDAHLSKPLAAFAARVDPDIPVVDLGCGNGRRSLWLARHFRHVVAVDVSAEAVSRAKVACAGLKNVETEVLDVTDREAVETFFARRGPVNIFVRGVLHVIVQAHRREMVASLWHMVGGSGFFFLRGDRRHGARVLHVKPSTSPSGLPAEMHKVIQHGIIPSGFGANEHGRWFPASEWKTIDSGPTNITTVSFGDGKPGPVPAHFGLLCAL